MRNRTVRLRDEIDDDVSTHVWAWIDGAGALHIDGHSITRGDEDHEWGHTFAAGDIPALVKLLGGGPNDHILDLLETWRGSRAKTLENILSRGDVPCEVWMR